jgi:hypothetical protein
MPESLPIPAPVPLPTETDAADRAGGAANTLGADKADWRHFAARWGSPWCARAGFCPAPADLTSLAEVA